MGARTESEAGDAGSTAPTDRGSSDATTSENPPLSDTDELRP
ncbi:hypothetical protein [Actinomyces oris]